jgi:hypothetical protein
MLGKLSIFGAVAGIFMIPTMLTAQMGGAVNPGVGAAFNRGAAMAGAVSRGIPTGLGRHPSRLILPTTVLASIILGPATSADDVAPPIRRAASGAQAFFCRLRHQPEGHRSLG